MFTSIIHVINMHLFPVSPEFSRKHGVVALIAPELWYVSALKAIQI